MQYGLMTRIKGLFRQPTKPQVVAVSVTPKLYRSIHDLPLGIFIDCQCEQLYDKLILQGEPTQEEITDAWENLLQQYTELIGGREVESKISEVKRVLRTESKISRMYDLIVVLKHFPNKESFARLYTFGIALPQLPYTIENVNKVISIFKGYYNLEKNRYKLMTQPKKENAGEAKKEISRNEFAKVLSRISIAFKMPPISINSISTAQYCTYVVDYREYCKSIEQQNEQNKK